MVRLERLINIKTYSVLVNSGGYLPRCLVNIHHYSPPLRWRIVNNSTVHGTGCAALYWWISKLAALKVCSVFKSLLPFLVVTMESNWGQIWNPLFMSWSHALWDISNHFVLLNSQSLCHQKNVWLHGTANSFSCDHVFSCVANRDIEARFTWQLFRHGTRLNLAP